MKVRFRVNLGSMDASKVGLDFNKCCKGMELEVSDGPGRWLVDKGIATEVAAVAAAADPPSEIRAVPEPPEIKGDTKADRGSAKKQD